MDKIRALLMGTSLAVGVALAGGSAYAADMGAPPAAAPAAPAGSYVSVFGGIAAPPTVSGNYSDSTNFDAPFNYGYILGGAIGTHLMPNLRGEVELSYTGHTASGTMTLNNGSGSTTVTDSGNLNTLYLLGNLWFDIDTGGTFTPYIGGGAGLAVVMPQNFGFSSGAEVFNTSATALAAQLGAGIKFQIADNMSVDLGYRAKEVFNATLVPTTGPNNATNVTYLDQTVQLGIDIGF